MNAVTEKSNIALTTASLMAAIQSELRDGEFYGGPVFKDGVISHHLAVVAINNDSENQAKQIKWAASVGGELPTIEEYAVLYANCKAKFKPRWYWSATQHPAGSGYAWIQHFDNGRQHYNGKSSSYAAVAVRRLSI